MVKQNCSIFVTGTLYKIIVNIAPSGATDLPISSR